MSAGIVTTPEFQETLARFVELLNALVLKHYEQFPNVKPPTITAAAHVQGQRYIRVISDDGVSRSAWGFIDATTGDILKADGWKRPAKQPRGSIYSDNPLAGCTSSGPAYLRR